MWKWIRQLLKTTPAADDFGRVKSAVEEILGLDLSTREAQNKHLRLVSSAFELLGSAISGVRKSANGYPSQPISAAVWINGAGLGQLSYALTQHLKNAGWLAQEERASALWAQATLAVCSHYHHLVGPAMLSNADCQERLGNKERASQLYASVAADFAFLVEDWFNENESPPEEELIAIKSLQTATRRLLALGTANIEPLNLNQIEHHASCILERSSTNQESPLK